MYKIINRRDNTVLIEQARVADTFLKRFLGLIPRKNISGDEALIFYNAGSIHMFFMRFPIDIVFLGKNSRVVRIVQGIKPWRVANCLSSKTTIEMACGRAGQLGLQVGDYLDIVKA